MTQVDKCCDMILQHISTGISKSESLLRLQMFYPTYEDSDIHVRDRG